LYAWMKTLNAHEKLRGDIDRSIPEVFDRVAARYAAREAISGADTSLTYRETADIANRVAQALLDLGINESDRVALFFDQRPVAVAVLLGVLKSAAIAVPLVPSHPDGRLRQIIADSEVRAVVTQRSRTAQARFLFGSEVPILEAEQLLPARRRGWPRVEPSSVALLFYTSGSTGEPKGVIQTHRNVLRNALVTSATFQVHADDRVTMLGTYGVAQSLTCMMMAMLRGATVCPFDIPRQGLAALARWLVAERITVFYSSATLFRSLARAVDETFRYPDVRLVRLGSERVTVADVEAHRRMFLSHTRLIVSYSSSETLSITIHDVKRGTIFANGIVPVGQPSAGVSVCILDDAGRELPPGEEGEIAVRSVYLSPGYWRDEARTAGAFRPVPGSPPLREYRTGDLGRLRADGCLEHLGRKDFRVKIRGFRVELEEIETVLAGHPDVVHAAAAARSGLQGVSDIVAYVQLRTGASLSMEAMRAFLSARLPDYMIPARFVRLSQMPMTPTGKVNRAALPHPEADRPEMAAEYVAPRTSLEQTIALVWQQVLGLERIGVDDDFLMLGGDSLRAAQVVSRVSAAVGVEVHMWELLEAASVAQLAGVVAAKGGSQGPASL
jgi:amino acid adenylation domain-containing protein